MSEDQSDSDNSVAAIQCQEDLDLVASTLDIIYQVEDNLSGGRALFSASITLTNQCSVTLGYSSPPTQWSIFFSHLRMVEPIYLPLDNCVDLEYAGIRFSHLIGCLFKMTPLKNFKPLQEGNTLSFKFNAQHYSASRTDVLPNWYLHVEGLEPRIIKCTEEESLSFVGPFNSPKRYKRFDYTLATGKRRYDIYQPFTPEVRFCRNLEVKAIASHLKPIIPTPVTLDVKSSKFVSLTTSGWSIAACGDFVNEAKYLSDKIGIPLSDQALATLDCDQMPSYYIVIRQEEIHPPLQGLIDSETYKVIVDASKNLIQILACNSAGAFYGVQTLLSLYRLTIGKAKGLIPDCVVWDAPRYPFRSMHVDISRNFQSKEEILRLLDMMATYKLNKLHFHLSDDEGWRIEIPGIPELTEIGSKRGHDPSENTCLLPLLGSGPFPHGLGCGHYSVEDYKEILRYAAARHIEVIPEIDMPGHSHAAVRAMRVRYNMLMAENKQKEAERYLLSDPSESVSSLSYSVKMLAENSMNPGLESTYTFIDKVITELKEMHKDIQPLRVFHLGGDEVPYEAWDESQACLALVESGKIDNIDQLMEYFVTRVGELAHKHGLELGAWQDGIVVKTIGPYNRSKFPNSSVLVHFWRNVWETGQVFDAHKLANSGYQVILAPGTHFYFDHPYEPDPEERGLYWACRFIDTQKVFNFIPENLLFNADVKLTGEKMSKSDLKLLQESEDFTALKKPENIKGLQGQIWTELIRTPEQFHSMIFPRLLALAERAWHKASWESMESEKRKPIQEKEWSSFAHTLGYKELSNLEANRVPYHIPPPGARISSDGQLELRSYYPGQPLSYSVDGGQTWQQYNGPADVMQHDEVIARASYHNGASHSRVVTLTVKTYTDSDDPNS